MRSPWSDGPLRHCKEVSQEDPGDVVLPAGLFAVSWHAPSVHMTPLCVWVCAVDAAIVLCTQVPKYALKGPGRLHASRAAVVITTVFSSEP